MKIFPADVVTKVNKRARAMRTKLCEEYEQKLKEQDTVHEKDMSMHKEEWAHEKVLLVRSTEKDALDKVKMGFEKHLKEKMEAKDKQLDLWKMRFLRENKEEEERKFEAYKVTVKRNCNKDLERAEAKIREEEGRIFEAYRDTFNRNCNKNLERAKAKIREESKVISTAVTNAGSAAAFNQLNRRCNAAMERLDIVEFAARVTPSKPVSLV